jgi:hypothetical protein
VIHTKEKLEIYSKFLITFEKTQANNRIIHLNKLLTTVLLLSKDFPPEEKLSTLFGIYAIGGGDTLGASNTQGGIVKRPNVRQMLDHICFAVIYAIPNLAYHSVIPGGFGVNSQKCAKIMEIKLEMQKKVSLNLRKQ